MNQGLHYVERGSGLPVVLLHSFPHTLEVWKHQIEALSKEYRVIAPDFCGFGRSPAPAGRSVSIQLLADEVENLLKRLDALPCVLAGLSLGGYVALAYAKKCPMHFKGLILVDTRAEGDSPEGRQGRTKLAERVLAEGSHVVADAMLDKMLSERTRRQRPELVAEVRRMMESCPPDAVADALLAIRDRDDMREILPSIADPTLIIVGEEDAITSVSSAEAMQRAIPKAGLVVIPGAGHLSPLEAPEEVTGHMQRFLAEVR